MVMHYSWQMRYLVFIFCMGFTSLAMVYASRHLIKIHSGMIIFYVLIALGIPMEEPIVMIAQLLPTQNIATQQSMLKEFDQRFGRIIYQKNSAFGVVTVGEDARGIAGLRSLYFKYRDMCGMQVRSE
jgi:hypothetical protein